MPADTDFTIADLARLTGLNVRTIRYWISQGLIPASGESGPGAHYGQGHLDRLRLIKRLQAEYLPNAEIRRRLSPLSDEEVAGLVASAAPEPDPTRPTTSALEYVRGLLGVEAGPLPAPPAAPQASEARPTPPPPTSFRPIDAAPARGSLRAKLPSDLLSMPKGMPRLRALEPERSAGVAEAPVPEAPAPAWPAPEAPAPEAPSDESAAPMPERSQWERLSLGPNIELHIRRPLSRPEQRRVERLIAIARQVLDERNAP